MSAEGEPEAVAPQAAIAELEARIETLALALERCRKVALLARGAILLGAIWLVLMFVRALPADPAAVVAAIALGLGGIVLFGSNASTARQTAAALREAETARAALIGMLPLRPVEGAAPPRLLH